MQSKCTRCAWLTITTTTTKGMERFCTTRTVGYHDFVCRITNNLQQAKHKQSSCLILSTYCSRYTADTCILYHLSQEHQQSNGGTSNKASFESDIQGLPHLQLN
jgi:hypothetical protein